MNSNRFFFLLLGLSTAAIGALFVFLMWQSYSRAVAQKSWPQAEGIVLASETVSLKHDEFSPTEYQLKLLYGYEWKGKAVTGERHSVRGNAIYNKRDKIDALVKKYKPGTKVTVYVNPNDEKFAVLKTDSKAAGYTLWFPLLFVIGGLGIVWRGLTMRKTISEPS